MRILFVGDVFGSPGRKIVRDHLAHVVESNAIDLTIINAENSAGGFGVTPSIADDLFALGADVLTTGNHVWDKKEIIEYLRSADVASHGNARRLLRPANYPPANAGFGWYEGQTKQGMRFAVINLQGRTFMVDNDDPFRKVDELLKNITSKVIFVDLHAEATSEKIAMGWYLDGRVTAVIGTHTHVPTADERILPQGTAYLTDSGMTGPYDSVIGVEKEQVIERFLTSLPGRFQPASGDVRFCAVIIDCDENTGKASSIKRLMLGE